MNRFSMISSPPKSYHQQNSNNKSSSLSSLPPTQHSSNNTHLSSTTTSLIDGSTSSSAYADAHLTDYLMNEMMICLTESARYSIKRTIKNRNKNGEEEEEEEEEEKAKNDNLKKEKSSSLDLKHEDLHRSVIDEACRIRLDSAGYKVGWVLAERLTRDKPRFPRVNSTNSTPDHLEVIKFICKDLWISIYNKQADNLRTNHRGIFVIQDHSYRPFLRLGSPIGLEDEMNSLCRKMMTFPLGVIRGSLMNLGIQSIVSAEIAVPQCTFQIRTAVIIPPQNPPQNPKPN